jgi:hypothetical protein
MARIHGPAQEHRHDEPRRRTAHEAVRSLHTAKLDLFQRGTLHESLRTSFTEGLATRDLAFAYDIEPPGKRARPTTRTMPRMSCSSASKAVARCAWPARCCRWAPAT